MDDALPLIATGHDEVLEDALRWCAAVGCTPEVTSDVAGVRRGWRAAPLVVLGDDLAPAVARAGLPRRDHVLLLARDREAALPVAVAVGAVDVVTAVDESRALDALTRALDGRGEACVVSVVAGSGGAGASTVAAGLAHAAASRGLSALLLDADPLGGGIELLLGSERADGLRWHDLATQPIGAIAAGSLSEALPGNDGLAVLSWGRDGPDEVPAALDGVLPAAMRGFDVVVADVPRHLDLAGQELVARSVLTVLVVPEDVRAVGSARAVLRRLDPHTSSVAVVSAARPGGVGEEALSKALGLPVLARLGRDRRLSSSVDHGHGPGRSRPVRRVATVLLDLLGAS